MNTASAKMDKSRGARKQQQHSSANLIFAKKEKIRRLSSVNGIQHSKTKTGSFCWHPQLSSPLISKSTAKRFKILRKISDDCNVVDHASVPRKLRSAMKKPVPPHSPDSKKPNGSLSGVESHRKDGPKKPKLNLKQAGSDRPKKATVSTPITKDEEEVVETLYALAGMFPDDDSLGLRSSAQPDTAESLALLEVKREDTSSAQAAKIVPSSTVDESSNEADKHDSNEPSTREQPDLPEGKKLNFKPDSTISKMRANTGIPFFKSEPDVGMSCIHRDRGVLSEPSLEAGLKQKPKQQVTNLFERKTEMEFGVMGVESRVGHTIRELRKNGLTLWPGLSSIVPVAPQSPSSSQSVANTILTWLDPANYGPQTHLLETGYSTEKVLKIARDRNRVKRSAIHVYISCLIHSLQMPDNKDGILQQTLWHPNNCNNLRNARNGNVPGSTPSNTATDRNSYEARSGIIPPQKILQQEQPHTASASGMNTSKGQRFDFLSLSPGGVGIDGNNNYGEVCNTIGSTSQLQVPRLHSHPQNQSLMPFSISPTDYTSSACMDQFSTATATPQVHLQLPQYPSSPFCDPPYTSHSGVKKQQQRQRLWAAHIAAQYQPHGTSTVLTQFSSRQNGKPELSISMPCAQTAIPPHPTLDAFGPKYYSVSQYQQPKFAYTSSLPPTRVKRTDHRFSSVCEESNGGFSADRPLASQLLRN